MLKNVISVGNFAIWPQIGLLLFLFSFIGILIWVRRKNSTKHYQYMAGLAINDGAVETHHER